MRILYVQERRNKNGATDRLSTSFDCSEIIVGRGGASTVIVSSKKVSLTHARVFFANGQWMVSDLQSLVGVRVNNVRVASSMLATGDVIGIGDVTFSVGIVGDEITLIQGAPSDPVMSTEEELERLSQGLHVESYLPRMRTLSFLCGALVLMVWAFLPGSLDRFDSWNSGPISNAHKTIERDCRRCHSAPFRPVQDKDCLSCHSMTQHAKEHDKFISQHPSLSMRCAECHMEHNGDHGLVSKDSRQCVSCHGGIRELRPESEILDVISLARHPQFRVAVTQPDGTEMRVSLEDKANAKDATPLKLNHAVHLKQGLRGANGPTTLQCNSCHALASDEGSMQPISFDTHCRDCHSLGFDERLPNTQLPHGDAETIYPTLFAEYAKLLLLNNGEEQNVQRDQLRAMPLGTELPTPKNLAPEALKVQQAARVAEEEVFTRTGCYLCHEYREKPVSEQKDDQTRYTISKPNVPSTFMTKAQFDHSAHENVTCESCHEKTRTSTETSELLLPGIDTCRQCHFDGEKAGFVRSGCAECHGYHKSLEVPSGQKRTLTDYLRSLAR